MCMTVTAELAGERFDKTLAVLLPEASLRHRRRLAETGAALLNGRPVRPGAKVRQGQVVELAGTTESACFPVCPEGVRVLARADAYAAVTKPAGVHSAQVAGSGGASVEACLPELFPSGHAALLNRLDLGTSGFVLVALGENHAAGFRALEQAGRVRKEYLALAHGRLEEAHVVENRLDMAERAKVRVLAETDPDPARHTRLEPLEYRAGQGLGGETTLVRAVIARGARHQIRAHLAHLGHAIVGDDLYGDGLSGEGGGVLYLHHRALSFEGFEAVLEPDWDFSFPDIS